MSLPAAKLRTMHLRIADGETAIASGHVRNLGCGGNTRYVTARCEVRTTGTWHISRQIPIFPKRVRQVSATVEEHLPLAARSNLTDTVELMHPTMQELHAALIGCAGQCLYHNQMTGNSFSKILYSA